MCYLMELTVCSKSFTTLPPHALSAHSNGTAPRSSVISSEIYGQQSQPSRPLVFEDNPIELTFTIELVQFPCV